MLSGRTQYFPSKSPVAETVTLHVYNVTLGRLEGTLQVHTCVEFATGEDLVRHIRAKALHCVPPTQAHGPVWLCEARTALAWLQPLHVRGGLKSARHLSLLEADLEATQGSRRRQCLEDTHLRGAPPQQSLRSTCHHFVDRLCMEDLAKLRENLSILDGLTISVASTCSGVESSVPVVEHTLACLNERFGVQVGSAHVLSCDSDKTRQQFMLRAHGSKIGVLVADCRELTGKTVHCVRTDSLQPMPRADLLVTGPSCANVSGVRQDAARYVGCLESQHPDHETCESSITFTHGVLSAADQLQAHMVLYENVAKVLHHCKDSNGDVHPSAITTVQARLVERGFAVQCRQMDTQDFALPQRRNRAWLMASQADVARGNWQLDVDDTISDMSSSVRVQDIFVPGLPKGKLSNSARKELETVLDKRCGTSKQIGKTYSWTQACQANGSRSMPWQ